MGKTAWAINIAQNAAVKGKAVVAVFSLEMSKEALLRRMLASQAWVDQRKLQTGFLGRDDRTSCAAPSKTSSNPKSSSTTPPASRSPRCAPRPAASSRPTTASSTSSSSTTCSS
jgi:hypothetical protein